MESSSEEGRRLLDVSRVVRGGTIQSEGKGAFALARKGGLFSGLLTSHRSAPVVRLRQQSWMTLHTQAGPPPSPFAKPPTELVPAALGSEPSRT
jgi:hypothetical protein